MELYEILNTLNIKYKEVKHEAAYTVSDMDKININLDGIGCKNLFLKNKDNKFYLVVLPDKKRANIKEIEKIVDAKNLSFASPDTLEEILNLKPGSVTPLGIMNDKENKVTVILDKELQNNHVLIHPLINTKTVSIYYDDLIRFIEYFKHKYICI